MVTCKSTVPAATPPTPVVVHPSPPSREFIARLKAPSRPWLLDYTDAELKSSMRAALAARGTTRARLYADELARRNTLYDLERRHGYAALSTVGGCGVMVTSLSDFRPQFAPGAVIVVDRAVVARQTLATGHSSRRPGGFRDRAMDRPAGRLTCRVLGTHRRLAGYTVKILDGYTCPDGYVIDDVFVAPGAVRGLAPATMNDTGA